MTTTSILISLGLFLAYMIYNYWKIKKSSNIPQNEAIVELTSQNFNRQTKNGVMLVDFWADWCMPCKMMVPILNNVVTELPREAKVGKVDIQKYNDLASKLKVRNIPTMILFKDGIEVNRFVGVKQKDFLLKEILKTINS